MEELQNCKSDLGSYNSSSISPFYNAVCVSLSGAESMCSHGFENSLDYLVNRENWNSKRLKVEISPNGMIEFLSRPRLSVYKEFTPTGFEIHCIPWIDDKEFDYPLKSEQGMDFKCWEPKLMKVVFRVNQLHSLIQQYSYFESDAALRLIRAAHIISEAFIETKLCRNFNIQCVRGLSVKDFFDGFKRKPKQRTQSSPPIVYKIGPVK